MFVADSPIGLLVRQGVNSRTPSRPFRLRCVFDSMLLALLQFPRALVQQIHSNAAAAAAAAACRALQLLLFLLPIFLASMDISLDKAVIAAVALPTLYVRKASPFHSINLYSQTRGRANDCPSSFPASIGKVSRTMAGKSHVSVWRVPLLPWEHPHQHLAMPRGIRRCGAIWT